MSVEISAEAIAAAILAHPDRNDRQVARLLGLGGYTRVRAVRAALAAPDKVPALVEASPALVEASPAPVEEPAEASPTLVEASPAPVEELPPPAEAPALVEAPAPAAAPAQPERHACPHCGKTLPTANGIKVHIARVHGRAPVDPPPPVVEEPPPPAPVVAPRPLVVCAICYREGTPSRHDARLCVACGASEDIAAARARRFAEAFRCECGRPFAQSAHNPAKCIKCTGEYDRSTRQFRQGYSHAAD